MKSYQYFLFDWDGNLAQTLDIWLSALKQSLERSGHHLSDKEIGADYAAFRLRMLDRRMVDIDTIIDEAKEISAQKEPGVELYPDTIEVLEFLKSSGKQTALVTTSTHAQIDPLLKKHNLSHVFDGIVCGDDVMNLKPSPEPLEKALKLLKGSKRSAIMIGDSEKDIEAANNAGIDSALFHSSEHSIFYDLDSLKLLHPTMIVEDFRELMRLV